MIPTIVARLVAKRNADEYSRIIFFMVLFEVVALAARLKRRSRLRHYSSNAHFNLEAFQPVR
jgi:hypothetical protein